MNKDVTGLRCDCDTNPDLDGFWSRKEVEVECDYISMPKEEWMSYIFGHLFADCPRWTAKLEEMFIENDVVSMTVNLGEDKVKITKLY